MALFLFRFYPVLIPLLLYLVWLNIVRRRARKSGEPIPEFRDGPVFLLLVSSLLIGILCFLVLAFSMDSIKGNYEPSRMEGERVIPAQIKP